MWPDKAVGSSTVSFFCCNVGSISPLTGQPSVMADVVGGGTGATAFGDGIDGVDTYMSNVGVMPTEVVETNYSVRVLKTEFIPGSQGLGTFNGGLGLRREYQIVGGSPAGHVLLRADPPRLRASWGQRGGDALPTRITVIGPDGAEITGLAEKASVTLQPGTVLRVETAGGGGYGDPRARSAEAADYYRRNGRV